MHAVISRIRCVYSTVHFLITNATFSSPCMKSNYLTNLTDIHTKYVIIEILVAKLPNFVVRYCKYNNIMYCYRLKRTAVTLTVAAREETKPLGVSVQ